MKPNNYREAKKLFFDWTDKKKYLIQYIVLKYFVRHWMVVDKVHETFSLEQIKWLEIYMSFNTQKQSKPKKTKWFSSN